MIDLLAAAPGRAETARRVALPTLAAVATSAVLTSVSIVILSGGDASKTLTVAEFWEFVFPISILTPALVCPALALHMARLLWDLRRARDELVSVAHMDPLTGLLNRRGFDLAAAVAFAESRRRRKSIVALMCDIDKFKAINDKYGHEFGDLALKSVADLIRASIGERMAVLSRRGGEEFAILLPGIDVAEGVEVAEIVRAACAANSFESEGVAARITLSIGIATQQPDEAEARTLLALADAALYQAKRDGRNRVVPAFPNRRFG